LDLIRYIVVEDGEVNN